MPLVLVCDQLVVSRQQALAHTVANFPVSDIAWTRGIRASGVVNIVTQKANRPVKEREHRASSMIAPKPLARKIRIKRHERAWRINSRLARRQHAIRIAGFS